MLKDNDGAVISQLKQYESSKYLVLGIEHKLI
jgi:hypothetical protein